MNKTELKYNVIATGSCFFDRSSMRFFGDTMANYYTPNATTTVKTSSGDTVECFELRRIHPVKHNLNSTSYFNAQSFDRVLPDRG